MWCSLMLPEHDIIILLTCLPAGRGGLVTILLGAEYMTNLRNKMRFIKEMARV